MRILKTTTVDLVREVYNEPSAPFDLMKVAIQLQMAGIIDEQSVISTRGHGISFSWSQEIAEDGSVIGTTEPAESDDY